MRWLIDKLIEETVKAKERKVAELEDEIIGLERIFNNLNDEKKAEVIDRITDLRDEIESILRGLYE